MDHDFYTLFSRFWWLIFPLFWMIMGLSWGWSRHARANRALDILKSYADQGKDPPPELLKGLQGGMDGYYGWGGWGGWGGRWGWRYSFEGRLYRTFLFSALAVAFAVLAFWHGGPDLADHRHGFGFLMPLVIFVALALSNGLSLLFWPRNLPPSDPDGPRR